MKVVCLSVFAHFIPCCLHTRTHPCSYSGCLKIPHCLCSISRESMWGCARSAVNTFRFFNSRYEAFYCALYDVDIVCLKFRGSRFIKFYLSLSWLALVMMSGCAGTAGLELYLASQFPFSSRKVNVSPSINREPLASATCGLDFPSSRLHKWNAFH